MDDAVIFPCPPAAAADPPLSSVRRRVTAMFAALLAAIVSCPVLAGPQKPSAPSHASAPSRPSAPPAQHAAGGFGGPHPGGFAPQQHVGGYAQQPHGASYAQQPRGGGYGQSQAARAPQAPGGYHHSPGPAPNSMRRTSPGGMSAHEHLHTAGREDRGMPRGSEGTRMTENRSAGAHDHFPGGHLPGDRNRFAYARPAIAGLHHADLPRRDYLHANAHRDLAAEHAFVDHHRGDFHAHRWADFSPHERALWRRGLWRNEWHYGRRGWWWEAGGAWYPYADPTFPYPLVVADLAVYDSPVVDGPDLEPLVDQPEDPSTEAAYTSLMPGTADAQPLIPPLPAPPQGWFYCGNPSGYFPDTSTCSVDWQLVQTPPPAPAQ